MSPSSRAFATAQVQAGYDAGIAEHTAVPSIHQSNAFEFRSLSEARDLFATQPGVDRLTARLIRAAFDAAEIEHRHTVLAQLALSGAPCPDDGTAFIDGERFLLRPTTGTRNDLYIRTAPTLYAEAARVAEIVVANGGELRKSIPWRTRKEP